MTFAKKWPAADLEPFAEHPERLSSFPIDHEVVIAPLASSEAGAQKRLRAFLKQKLERYEDDRNQPQQDVTSGLSPYLHFGRIGVHQVFSETMERDGWSPGKLAAKTAAAEKAGGAQIPKSNLF